MRSIKKNKLGKVQVGTPTEKKSHCAKNSHRFFLQNSLKNSHQSHWIKKYLNNTLKDYENGFVQTKTSQKTETEKKCFDFFSEKF